MYIPSGAPPVVACYKYFWSMFLYLAVSTLYYILSDSSRHPVCVFFCDIAVTFFPFLWPRRQFVFTRNSRTSGHGKSHSF